MKKNNGETSDSMDFFTQRTEQVEYALEGFEMAPYVPPSVVRLEEEDEYEDVVKETGHHGNSCHSDDNIFKEFFSTDGE